MHIGIIFRLASGLRISFVSTIANIRGHDCEAQICRHSIPTLLVFSSSTRGLFVGVMNALSMPGAAQGLLFCYIINDPGCWLFVFTDVVNSGGMYFGGKGWVPCLNLTKIL